MDNEIMNRPDGNENPQPSNASVSSSYDFGAFRRLFTLSCVIAAIVAVLRTVSLCLFYDEGMGLVARGAILHYATDILTFAGICLAIIVTIIIGKKKTMPDMLPDPTGSVISTGILTGLAMIGLFAYLMYRGVHESVNGSGTIVWTVMLIFMIPAAIYFFKTAISKRPYSRASAALGFAPVLWAAFFLISVYFERDTILNNTLRVYTQMSLIAVMTFFLNEVRFLVGKARTTLYCAIGNAAIIMLSASAAPKLICAFVLCLEPSSDVVYGIVEIFLLLCITTRMALYTSKRSTFFASQENDEDFDEDTEGTEE